MKLIVLALALITLHGPTGARIDLNGETISSLRDPSAMPEGHYGKGVRCIVIADGGRPLAIRETCDEVRRLTMKPHGPCALVCGESPKR